MQTLYFLKQDLITGDFSLIHNQEFYKQYQIKEFSTSNMEFMEELCLFMQEYFPEFPNAQIIRDAEVEDLFKISPQAFCDSSYIFYDLIKKLDRDGYATHDIFDYNSIGVHVFFNEDKYSFVFEEGVNEFYIGNGYYDMLSSIGYTSNSLIHKVMIDPSKISNNPIQIIRR